MEEKDMLADCDLRVEIKMYQGVDMTEVFRSRVHKTIDLLCDMAMTESPLVIVKQLENGQIEVANG